MNGLIRKFAAIAVAIAAMSSSMLAVSAEESARVSLRIQLLSGTNPEVVAEEAISVGETQSLCVTNTSFNRDDFEDLILGLEFGADSDKSWDDVQVMDITVSSIVLNDSIEMMTESQNYTLSQAAGTGFKLGSLVDINSDKWLEPIETGSPSSSYITVDSMTVTFTVTDFSLKTETTTTTTETTSTSKSEDTTTTSSFASETTTATTSPSPTTSTSRTVTTTETKTTTQPDNGTVPPPPTGDSGVEALLVLVGIVSSVMALSYTHKRTAQD